jgi:hypothetical protein
MELLVGVPDQQSASVIQIDGKTAQLLITRARYHSLTQRQATLPQTLNDGSRALRQKAIIPSVEAHTERSDHCDSIHEVSRFDPKRGGGVS